MKNKLLNDEMLYDDIVTYVASTMRVGKETIKMQLKNLDDDKIRELIHNILNTKSNPEKHSIKSLISYLETIFEQPMVHITEFYKRLSEKFNGKYSPEELELIFDSEKQLVASLLLDNDFIETKSSCYVVKYDEDCIPFAVSVSPHVDIVDAIKTKSISTKLKESK